MKRFEQKPTPVLIVVGVNPITGNSFVEGSALHVVWSAKHQPHGKHLYMSNTPQIEVETK